MNHRIETAQLADGLWYYRILDVDGREVGVGPISGDGSKRDAIQSGRRRMERWEESERRKAEQRRFDREQRQVMDQLAGQSPANWEVTS